MPVEVKELLERISFSINFSIDGFGVPLQCLGLQSMFNKLLFQMVTPFVFVGGIYVLVVVQVAVLAKRRGMIPGVRTLFHDAALKWLPLAQVTSFLVFPSVSALAFRGLEDCETWTCDPPIDKETGEPVFDHCIVQRAGETFVVKQGEPTHRYLRADYSVDCMDETLGSMGILSEYNSVFALSWIAILSYPASAPLDTACARARAPWGLRNTPPLPLLLSISAPRKHTPEAVSEASPPPPPPPAIGAPTVDVSCNDAVQTIGPVSQLHAAPTLTANGVVGLRVE